MTKSEAFKDFLTYLNEKCLDKDIQLKWTLEEQEPHLYVKGRYTDIKDLFCGWLRYYLMRVLEDDN